MRHRRLLLRLPQRASWRRSTHQAHTRDLSSSYIGVRRKESMSVFFSAVPTKPDPAPGPADFASLLRLREDRGRSKSHVRDASTSRTSQKDVQEWSKVRNKLLGINTADAPHARPSAALPLPHSRRNRDYSMRSAARYLHRSREEPGPEPCEVAGGDRRRHKRRGHGQRVPTMAGYYNVPGEGACVHARPWEAEGERSFGPNQGASRVCACRRSRASSTPPEPAAPPRTGEQAQQVGPAGAPGSSRAGRAGPHGRALALPLTVPFPHQTPQDVRRGAWRRHPGRGVRGAPASGRSGGRVVLPACAFGQCPLHSQCSRRWYSAGGAHARGPSPGGRVAPQLPPPPARAGARRSCGWRRRGGRGGFQGVGRGRGRQPIRAGKRTQCSWVAVGAQPGPRQRPWGCTHAPRLCGPALAGPRAGHGPGGETEG